VTQRYPTDVRGGIKHDDRISEYEALYANFDELCDLGGRLLGTESEQAAVAWISSKFAKITGEATLHPVRATIWKPTWSRLMLEATGRAFECQPMLHTVSTPPGGLVGKIVDLGKGRPESYEGIGDALKGNIALVEHEYPFSPIHMHRREKIRLAIRHGAKAVLMANPTGDGGLLSGSSAREDGFEPIPCGYVTRDFAIAIRSENEHALVVRLELEGVVETVESNTPSLVIGDPSLPRIVLSAHLDGHPLGESALDNGSGVVVAIAAAQHLASLFQHHQQFALQTIIFTAEEWSLSGSEDYLKQLSDDQRKALVLNVNLDTVGGSPNLTALTSGFPRLATLIERASARADIKVGTYLPLLANSDHFNFARAGVPAFRLLAGFDEPQSRVQHILSGSDTRDKVCMSELANALNFVCAVIETATESPELLLKLRSVQRNEEASHD
jgi:aminopeptidase YwaD